MLIIQLLLFNLARLRLVSERVSNHEVETYGRVLVMLDFRLYFARFFLTLEILAHFANRATQQILPHYGPEIDKSPTRCVLYSQVRTIVIYDYLQGSPRALTLCK